MRQYELDYYISTLSSDEIQHHGVLGQKWGVRRYQNADGSLTAEGRERYSNGSTSIKAATQYCDKHNRIGEAYSWIKENPNISEKDWKYALAVRDYHYGKAESKIADIAKKTVKPYSEVRDETQNNSQDKDKTSFAIASATSAYKSFEKTGVVPRDKDYDAFVVKVQNMRASGKSLQEIRRKLDPYNKFDMDVYIDDMDEIQHHGVQGQKWGVRRYQNKDGSLTAEGQSRYSSGKYEKIRAKAERKAARLTEKGRDKALDRKMLKANLAANSVKSAYGARLKSSTGSGFLTGTRGRLTKAGAMKQAAKLQGYQEGRTGRKMTVKQANELRNTIYKNHNTDFKKHVQHDLVQTAIATASLGALASTPITGPVGLGLGMAGPVGMYGKYFYDMVEDDARLNSAIRSTTNALGSSKRRTRVKNVR